MKRLISAALASALFASPFCYGAVTPLPSVQDGRIQNIRIAADSIDNTVLQKGDVFSFNDIVGPRTSSRGFVSGINGRGVNVTGGGVAQVASTIYLALRESGADVTFTDRYTYGSRYSGEYVTDSSDAILVDYASGIDFSFVCNEQELYIDLELDETTGQLSCRCYLPSDDLRRSRSAVQMFSLSPAMNDTSASYETADDSEETFYDMFEDFEAASDETDGSSMDAHRSVLCSASIDLSETDEATRTNIRLAADSISGMIISQGSTFSFNRVVGPRTSTYGYLPAENGRGVVVTGGGVAQVASAIWLAISDCDLISVMERSTYGQNFVKSYVQSSNDAILTDYKAGIDFSFRNDSTMDITIIVTVSDNCLYCTLYY